MHPLLQTLIALFVLAFVCGLIGLLVYTGVWGLLLAFHRRLSVLEIEQATTRKVAARVLGASGAQRKQDKAAAEEQNLQELRQAANIPLPRARARPPLQIDQEGLVHLTPEELARARAAADKEPKS